MIRYTYIFLAGAMLFSLSACVKDLLFEQQNKDKKIVVNCLLDGRRPIKVYLTESTSSVGNSHITPINDAVVELYKNDSFWLTLPYLFVDTAQTFGGYITYLLPEPGNKYSVKISHPTYGVAGAEDTLSERVQQYSCQMVQQGDSSNGFIAKLKLRFHENGTKENFYRLVVWQQGMEYRVNAGKNDTSFQAFEIPSPPQLTTTLMDTIRDGGNPLFSDVGLNGNMVEIDFSVKTEPVPNLYYGHLFVDFGEVSRVHYNYFKTMYYYQNSGIGYEDYYIFSNVKNGYGIFMSQSLLPDSFDLR